MPDTPLDRASGDAAEMPRTWSQVRHDVRNFLNAIKLSSAVLRRRGAADETTKELLGEIDRAADSINELITQHSAAAEGVKQTVGAQ